MPLTSMASGSAHPYHGRMDSNDPRALREQLTEAITNVRRQIDVQQRSHGALDVAIVGPTGREEVIRGLEAELIQLEQALADLGPEHA
jgi:hypothetical protein